VRVRVRVRARGKGGEGGGGLHQDHVVLPCDQDERDAATEHEQQRPDG